MTLKEEFEKEFGHAWHGSEVRVGDEFIKIPSLKYSDWLEKNNKKLKEDLVKTKDLKIGSVCAEIRLKAENEDLKTKLSNGVELNEAYKGYVELLVAELEELVPAADNRGWKTTRYEEGLAFREKIKHFTPKKGIVWETLRQPWTL